jgi:hypothetical protein
VVTFVLVLLAVVARIPAPRVAIAGVAVNVAPEGNAAVAVPSIPITAVVRPRRAGGHQQPTGDG